MSNPVEETIRSQEGQLDQHLEDQGAGQVEPVPAPISHMAAAWAEADRLSLKIAHGGLDYQDDGKDLMALVHSLDQAQSRAYPLTVDRDRATRALLEETARHYDWEHSRQSAYFVRMVLGMTVAIYRNAMNQSRPELVGL